MLPSHVTPELAPEFLDRLIRVFGEVMIRTAQVIVEASEAMRAAVARIFGVEPESLDVRSLSWSRIRRKAGIQGKHGRRSTSRERRRRRTQAIQAERCALRRVVDVRRAVSGDLFP